MSAGERASQFLGSWRLESSVDADATGKPLPQHYGPLPMGCLVLTEAGRMMIVIVDGRKDMPRGEKRAYASYCGNFVIEGDRLITTVDAALLPERIGGQQIRRLALRDGKLMFYPPAGPAGEQREMIWVRDERANAPTINGGPADPSRPYGTWRLIAATAVDSQGSPARPPYGPKPMGRVVLNEAGRMMAVLVDGRTAMPAGETRAYASYCGNFEVRDNKLITTVDAALHAERIGGQQIRGLAFRGENLVLIPPRRANGEQRELIWQLDGPA